MNNIIYYTENDIKLFQKNYELNNEKLNIIFNESFKNILKLCETYESNNKKQYNTKYKFNNKKNKHNNNNNNNNIRNIPKERPKTFLNTSKGEIDDLNKELNGNLNKLSSLNYDKIYKKIVDIFINKNEIFDYNYFIDNLFSKSVMQPTFCPLYVRILIIMKEKSLLEYKEEKISYHLIEKCNSFKSMITEFKEKEDDILNPNNYDDFCEKNKKKIFKKGFSQFIGELYKNKFLDNVYLNDFIYLLYLNIKSNLDNDNLNIEDSIICFIQLINTTISKRQLRNTNLYNKIKELMNYKNIPKKIKFKLMDVVE